MKLDELIREVSKRTGYVQVDTRPIIKETFKVIADELEGHGFIRIPNFGCFDVYERKGRRYKHPETGELVQAPDKMYPRFRFSDNIKEHIL